MRILLALLALAACAAAHAQRIDGSTNPRPQQWREREDWDERRTPEPRPPARASKNTDTRKPAPITVVRPAEREDWEERERRQREQDQSRPKPASKPAKAMDGPASLTSVRPVPTTPPSKAEQMQRQMQHKEATSDSGNFRCYAHPVCDRSTGSYATCRGVEQVYSGTSWRNARQRIARDCAAVNNPDPCHCATQCSRVAQCGPI
jgi:hypothetical protein